MLMSSHIPPVLLLLPYTLADGGKQRYSVIRREKVLII